METLRLILRYAHLIGFALLLGGAVAQYFAGKFKINAAMAWGAGIQVLTGVLLSAPLGREVKPDPAKLAVKGVVAVLIAVMVLVPYFRKRKQEAGPVVASGHFHGIVLMTLANAAVAVFWR